MERKKQALEVVLSVVGDRPMAESVLERLQEEGFLHLGYGDRDIDIIVSTFAELFGVTRTTKQDRYAARRLAASDAYGGADGVTGLMKLYKSVSLDKYAPSASSVDEFERKLPAIVTYMRKKGQQGEVVQL